MLTPRRSGAFKRDVRRAERRGKDVRKLRAVLTLLIDGKPLPKRCKDHALKGAWSGFRDVHIEPDWLPIYRIAGDEVQFARVGTHADLFDE